MKLFLHVILFTSMFLCQSCSDHFEKDEYVGDKQFTLINEDSVLVKFPSVYKGKNLLLGFIFTNCPDVCPLTTHKFQMVQEELKKLGIDNFDFALISFDPDRDKPWILKDYARLRGINESNFKFYTGDKETIQKLLKKMSISAVAGDTSKTDDGELVYFFMHSDKMLLIDKDTKIRNEYFGSRTNTEDFVKDIKEL